MSPDGMSYLQPEVGNPYWPLPRDYPDKSPDKQRQMRRSVAMGQQDSRAMVEAWLFFQSYYLTQGDFYKNFRDPPAFHLQAIYDAQAYRYNLLAAPRGFAKSFLIGLGLPIFLLCTRKNFDIGLGLATVPMVEELSLIHI